MQDPLRSSFPLPRDGERAAIHHREGTRLVGYGDEEEEDADELPWWE
jgi:hypothetical protein